MDKKTIGILINIRLGSERLTKKHLKFIQDKVAIDWMLERLKNIISKIELPADYSICLIIVTGDEDINKPLEQVAERNSVELFFGAPFNIPLRHLQCADKYDLSYIIALDGDNIFTSEIAIGELVNMIINHNSCIVAKTYGLPLGMNAIFYTRKYLVDSMVGNYDKQITTDWHRIFKNIKNITLTNEDFKEIENFDKLRFTMDYYEDYLFFYRIITLIDNQFTEISTHEIIKTVLQNRFYLVNYKLYQQYWERFNKLRNDET